MSTPPMGSAYNGAFYSYASFNVLLMSVSVFVLARRAFENAKLSPRITVIVRELGMLSLGAYLVHMLVINVLGIGLEASTFPLVLPLSVLVYVISYCIALGPRRRTLPRLGRAPSPVPSVLIGTAHP